MHCPPPTVLVKALHPVAPLLHLQPHQPPVPWQLSTHIHTVGSVTIYVATPATWAQDWEAHLGRGVKLGYQG